MAPQPWTIVITRSEDQAPQFSRSLEDSGFAAVELPAISVQTRALDEECRKYLRLLGSGRFDWIVFTSTNGVNALHELQRSFGVPGIPAGIRIAVQGTKTGERVKAVFDRDPDLTPKGAVAEALLSEFCARVQANERVLLVSAAKTRGILSDGLRDHGAEVHRMVVYTTVARPLSRELLATLQGMDRTRAALSFFSPSAFESFLESVGEDRARFADYKIVSIGPITSRAIQGAGFTVWAEATDHTAEGVLRVLSERCR